mgnify:CR=1 FL=1
MAKGILGRKLGMTQIFDAAGNLVPVTVVECTANVVLQQKTVEELKDALEAAGTLDSLEQLGRTRIVQDWLVEHCKQVEAEE